MSSSGVNPSDSSHHTTPASAGAGGPSPITSSAQQALGSAAPASGASLQGRVTLPAQLTYAQMEERLEVWVREGSPDEQRAVAKTRILDCYQKMDRGTSLDLSELGALAIGLKRLQLIADKARRTQAVDPVEVELFLQVRLAEPLKLPVDTRSMLYPSCSAIQDSALPAIRDEILAKSSSKEDVINALLEQDFWRDKLRSDSSSYAFDFNEIVEAVAESSEGMDSDVQQVLMNEALTEKLSRSYRAMVRCS